MVNEGIKGMLLSCCVFSQNPRDFYLVGNSVQYNCVDGYYLSGDAAAQCTENQKWKTGAMVCKSMFSLHYLCEGDYVFGSIVCSLAGYHRNY